MLGRCFNTNSLNEYTNNISLLSGKTQVRNKPKFGSDDYIGQDVLTMPPFGKVLPEVLPLDLKHGCDLHWWEGLQWSS